MEANNMAAMREVLEKIAHYCDSPYGMDDPYCADGHILSDIAKEAIAKPPRNCDVGTAEEQYARYCKSLEKNSGKSVLDFQGHYELTAKCFAYWGQMPYDEVEDKK